MGITGRGEGGRDRIDGSYGNDGMLAICHDSHSSHDSHFFRNSSEDALKGWTANEEGHRYA